MTLIVEDGSSVAGANSMVSVAAADIYHAARNNAAWAALLQADKEAALVKASDSLADATRYPFKGQRSGGYAQRQPWPRSGVSERHGDMVPDNVVPWQVSEAVCYLAGEVAQGADLSPALNRGGMVRSESMGPISTTYADDAPVGTVYQAAMGMLAPLLRDGESITLEPQWYDDGAPTFDLGMHDNEAWSNVE